MSVFVGDCAVLKIPELDIKIALEIEKIEGDTAYFGKCISGIISLSDIVLEEGDVIEEGSVTEALVYWKHTGEMFPLKLIVGSVNEHNIFLKSCESSVPLKFLTDSEDVKIYGRKKEEVYPLSAKDCDNYIDGNCSEGRSADGCNKCCCSCETPCEARCICPKDYFMKEDDSVEKKI